MADKRKLVFIFSILLLAFTVVAAYTLKFPDLKFPAITASTTTVAAATTTAPASGTANAATTTAATTTAAAGTFQPSIVTLDIKSWGYSSDTITLLKGSTVTWTNFDSATHTVTSAGNFDSGDITAGKSWSHTFDKAGTFEYSCKYHPSMKAKVVITE